jgi:HAD superfamily phosphoserine phosphatase-like hydrolase
LIAYKLKLISNQQAKEKILGFFFSKMPVALFEEKCKAFANTILPSLIRPKALEEIQKLQSMDVEVVVVSASPQNWILPWTDSIGVALIATRLLIKDEKLTGKIVERNCHGEEKVNRIQANYTLGDYSRIFAYGDTSGDKPMLKLATISFYKPFR